MPQPPSPAARLDRPFAGSSARNGSETVPAAEISLSQEDLAEIDNVLRDEVPVGGPAPEAMPKS